MNKFEEVEKDGPGQLDKTGRRGRRGVQSGGFVGQGYERGGELCE